MANSQVGGATGGRAALFDAFAGSLLNVTLGGPPMRLTFRHRPTRTVRHLRVFAGVYRPDDGSPDPSFRIWAENDKLLTIGPGNMELVLWPRGDDNFFLRPYVADFNFLRDDLDNVSGVDVHFEGNNARLKRVMD